MYVHWRRYWSDAFRVGSEVHMVRFTKLSLEKRLELLFSTASLICCTQKFSLINGTVNQLRLDFERPGEDFLDHN